MIIIKPQPHSSRKVDNLCQDCKYLPENELKQLCELVCDLLLEESNIQPVSR